MKIAAPAPVHYRLAPGGGLFFALISMLLLLGCVLLAWLLALRQAQQTGAAIWIATVLAYAVAWFFSVRTMHALPTGWLVWTGKVWRLQSDQDALQAPSGKGQGAQLAPAYRSCTLVLDVQQAVLLRLHDGKGLPLSGNKSPASCWVWATRASDQPSWHALRCALVWAQTVPERADTKASRRQEVVS